MSFQHSFSAFVFNYLTAGINSDRKPVHDQAETSLPFRSNSIPMHYFLYAVAET
jgi:hypothetical protein